MEMHVNALPTDQYDAPRKARVLIIDDEPLVGRAFSRILDPEFDVAVVRTARDGLALIACGELFDVVLCDRTMPGMSGEGFIAWLRAEQPDLVERVVLVTADGSDVDAEHVLVKPVAAQTLRGVIADRLLACGFSER
jgi:DNA-binding NarL/FixJ family response regulator